MKYLLVIALWAACSLSNAKPTLRSHQRQETLDAAAGHQPVNVVIQGTRDSAATSIVDDGNAVTIKIGDVNGNVAATSPQSSPHASLISSPSPSSSAPASNNQSTQPAPLVVLRGTDKSSIEIVSVTIVSTPGPNSNSSERQDPARNVVTAPGRTQVDVDLLVPFVAPGTEANGGSATVAPQASPAASVMTSAKDNGDVVTNGTAPTSSVPLVLLELARADAQTVADLADALRADVDDGEDGCNDLLGLFTADRFVRNASDISNVTASGLCGAIRNETSQIAQIRVRLRLALNSPVNSKHFSGASLRTAFVRHLRDLLAQKARTHPFTLAYDDVGIPVPPPLDASGSKTTVLSRANSKELLAYLDHEDISLAHFLRRLHSKLALDASDLSQQQTPESSSADLSAICSVLTTCGSCQSTRVCSWCGEACVPADGSCATPQHRCYLSAARSNHPDNHLRRNRRLVAPSDRVDSTPSVAHATTHAWADITKYQSKPVRITYMPQLVPTTDEATGETLMRTVYVPVAAQIVESVETPTATPTPSASMPPSNSPKPSSVPQANTSALNTAQAEPSPSSTPEPPVGKALSMNDMAKLADHLANKALAAKPADNATFRDSQLYEPPDAQDDARFNAVVADADAPVDTAKEDADYEEALQDVPRVAGAALPARFADVTRDSDLQPGDVGLRFVDASNVAEASEDVRFAQRLAALESEGKDMLEEELNDKVWDVDDALPAAGDHAAAPNPMAFRQELQIPSSPSMNISHHNRTEHKAAKVVKQKLIPLSNSLQQSLDKLNAAKRLVATLSSELHQAEMKEVDLSSATRIAAQKLKRNTMQLEADRDAIEATLAAEKVPTLPSPSAMPQANPASAAPGEEPEAVQKLQDTSYDTLQVRSAQAKLLTDRLHEVAAASRALLDAKDAFESNAVLQTSHADQLKEAVMKVYKTSIVYLQNKLFELDKALTSAGDLVSSAKLASQQASAAAAATSQRRRSAEDQLREADTTYQRTEDRVVHAASTPGPAAATPSGKDEISIVQRCEQLLSAAIAEEDAQNTRASTAAKAVVMAIDTIEGMRREKVALQQQLLAAQHALENEETNNKSDAAATMAAAALSDNDPKVAAQSALDEAKQALQNAKLTAVALRRRAADYQRLAAATRIDSASLAVSNVLAESKQTGIASQAIIAASTPSVAPGAENSQAPTSEGAGGQEAAPVTFLQQPEAVTAVLGSMQQASASPSATPAAFAPSPSAVVAEPGTVIKRVVTTTVEMLVSNCSKSQADAADAATSPSASPAFVNISSAVNSGPFDTSGPSSSPQAVPANSTPSQTDNCSSLLTAAHQAVAAASNSVDAADQALQNVTSHYDLLLSQSKLAGEAGNSDAANSANFDAQQLQTEVTRCKEQVTTAKSALAQAVASQQSVEHVCHSFQGPSATRDLAGLSRFVSLRDGDLAVHKLSDQAVGGAVSTARYAELAADEALLAAQRFSQSLDTPALSPTPIPNPSLSLSAPSLVAEISKEPQIASKYFELVVQAAVQASPSAAAPASESNNAASKSLENAVAAVQAAAEAAGLPPPGPVGAVIPSRSPSATPTIAAPPRQEVNASTASPVASPSQAAGALPLDYDETVVRVAGSNGRVIEVKTESPLKDGHSPESASAATDGFVSPLIVPDISTAQGGSEYPTSDAGGVLLTQRGDGSWGAARSDYLERNRKGRRVTISVTQAAAQQNSTLTAQSNVTAPLAVSNASTATMTANTSIPSIPIAGAMSNTTDVNSTAPRFLDVQNEDGDRSFIELYGRQHARADKHNELLRELVDAQETAFTQRAGGGAASSTLDYVQHDAVPGVDVAENAVLRAMQEAAAIERSAASAMSFWRRQHDPLQVIDESIGSSATASSPRLADGHLEDDGAMPNTDVLRNDLLSSIAIEDNVASGGSADAPTAFPQHVLIPGADQRMPPVPKDPNPLYAETAAFMASNDPDRHSLDVAAEIAS